MKINKGPLVYFCTKYIFRGSWRKSGERFLLVHDIGNAIKYASTVKGRWPELEEIVKYNNPYWAYTYSIEVIRGRWKDAESLIMNSLWKNVYAHCAVFDLESEYEKTLFMLQYGDDIDFGLPSEYDASTYTYIYHNFYEHFKKRTI